MENVSSHNCTTTVVATRMRIALKSVVPWVRMLI
jgi:hypothetical protein